MNEKSFGTTLRALREREHLTVKEVITKLEKYGKKITDKTLYSYENDKRAASADMLLALCQIYNCTNILETFSDAKPDYSIPDDEEWKIIEKYRSLNAQGKKVVNFVIENECLHHQSLKEAQEASKKRIRTYEEKLRELRSVKSPYDPNTPSYISMVAEPSASYNVNAAHERTDIEVTDEMKKHNDAIMDDDSEWE